MDPLARINNKLNWLPRDKNNLRYSVQSFLRDDFEALLLQDDGKIMARKSKRRKIIDDLLKDFEFKLPSKRRECIVKCLLYNPLHAFMPDYGTNVYCDLNYSLEKLYCPSFSSMSFVF